jgi:hypothetical protein
MQENDYTLSEVCCPRRPQIGLVRIVGVKGKRRLVSPAPQAMLVEDDVAAT